MSFDFSALNTVFSLPVLETSRKYLHLEARRNSDKPYKKTETPVAVINEARRLHAHGMKGSEIHKLFARNGIHVGEALLRKYLRRDVADKGYITPSADDPPYITLEKS